MTQSNCSRDRVCYWNLLKKIFTGGTIPNKQDKCFLIIRMYYLLWRCKGGLIPLGEGMQTVIYEHSSLLNLRQHFPPGNIFPPVNVIAFQTYANTRTSPSVIESLRQSVVINHNRLLTSGLPCSARPPTLCYLCPAKNSRNCSAFSHCAAVISVLTV